MKTRTKRILAAVMTIILLASTLSIAAGATYQISNVNKRPSASANAYISDITGFQAATATEIQRISKDYYVKNSADYFVVNPVRQSSGKYESDLNLGTGNDIITLGLYFSNNASEAITYIYATIGEEQQMAGFEKTINGVTADFDLVDGWDVQKDPYTNETSNEHYAALNLNEETYGDKVYLYTTKNASLGSPITSIYIDVRDTALTEYTGTDRNYVKTEDGTFANLNSGAGGQYIYMYSLTTAFSPLAGSIFGGTNVWFLVAGIVVLAGAGIGATVYVKKNKKK